LFPASDCDEQKAENDDNKQNAEGMFYDLVFHDLINADGNKEVEPSETCVPPGEISVLQLIGWY
jgi:hypothetical protein